MDDTVVLTNELKQAWRTLALEVKKERKIKIEAFYSTFSQTYSLLSKHIAENSLDKSYVELIAEAFLFANIKDEKLDNTCLAAFVLTERMLAHCAFDSSPSVVESSTIYLVDARREVPLDFNDASESISKLTKIFEDIYWKNINS